MTELILSHFSLPRAHPIEERVRLAAEAGFDGIGLYVGNYAQLETDGFAPHGLRDLLAEHQIRLREIEVIPALGVGMEEREATAWRMADEFQCRYVQVIGNSGDDIAAAGRAFGSLCDRAADHGLVVGLEFVPFTDIVFVPTFGFVAFSKSFKTRVDAVADNIFGNVFSNIFSNVLSGGLRQNCAHTEHQ